MRISAIVVAAGRGRRLKAKTSKALVKIRSKPLIIYALGVLSRHPDIDEIVLVTSSPDRQAIVSAITKYRIAKVKAIVSGGARRQDSVYNGLRAVAGDSQLVLVHDAARPFVDKKIISAVIKEASVGGAAIAGVPVKATIKEIAVSHSSLVVSKTIDRNRLWEIQTPQVFKKDLILAAYKKFGKTGVTDDAMLIEKMGKKVSIVRGSYNNIKITTPEDLIVAGVMAKICKLA